MNENGKATLVGVVSFGFECAHPNYPGIYTKIASFYHWIKSKMKHESKPMDKHEGRNRGFRTNSLTSINPLDFQLSYFKKQPV